MGSDEVNATLALPIEIERRFLLSGVPAVAEAPRLLIQGYLSAELTCTTRVRIDGEAAFLTLKGKKVAGAGAEFEYPIPLDHAKALLALCQGRLIEKRRYTAVHADKTWEIDEFLGPCAGLVIAEIELGSAEETFERPEWLGAEITHDHAYSNSSLSLQGTRSPEASGGGATAIRAGAKLFEFSSFEDWVSNARRKFRRCGHRSANVLCLDAKGRICSLGLHFNIAEEDSAYPITAYVMREDGK